MRKRYYRRKQRLLRWFLYIVLFIVILFAIVKVTDFVHNGIGSRQNVDTDQPEFEVDLLTINEYSRPGITRNQIRGIVIHYTANPGSTAKQNRDYFEGLKDSKITKASSHFIVGIDGEIIQCVPTAEIAYASNERNADTISIECCHPDETGKYTDATYASLVELVAWLCGKFDLDVDDIIRHYDVTGKACPLYFVEHEDAWEAFKQDVQDYRNKYGKKIK